ncbi:MAG: hypothetical protein QXM55_05195, partial [Ignisphaera sp.]
MCKNLKTINNTTWSSEAIVINIDKLSLIDDLELMVFTLNKYSNLSSTNKTTLSFLTTPRLS